MLSGLTNVTFFKKVTLVNRRKIAASRAALLATAIRTGKLDRKLADFRAVPTDPERLPHSGAMEETFQSAQDQHRSLLQLASGGTALDRVMITMATVASVTMAR